MNEYRHPRALRSASYTWVLLPATAWALTLMGCGSNRPPTIPVSGVVTVDGQPPAGPGAIYFTPLKAAAGYPTRPGLGKFDAAGRYEAQTFEPGDGLLPGRYRLSVHCWQTPPNMDGKPVVSYIAAKYQSAASSDLEEFVLDSKGGRVKFNLDLDRH